MALMTKYGLQKLRADQNNLLIEEKKSVEDVAIARSYGDFSENAELDAANAKLERVRKKLIEVEHQLVEVEIFNSTLIDKMKVNFGAEVHVRDESNDRKMVYKIVGEIEADLKNGKISIQSPLARALLGKTAGDECNFTAPSGDRTLIIDKIEYTWLEAK